MTGEQNHNSDFRRLIERRRKFIDGLEANRGEINLDIFEDFYPDRAHFVYELLQNAEDAGATEVSFTLMADRVICEHDGRMFTIEDVTSITGIHDSTKAKSKDKIGKFGVGFKSVFVYTQVPAIVSGDFAFQIVQQVLPEQIASDTSLGHRTRFEFPFNNPKKPPQEAYAEIGAGLNGLDEKTLLFLSNLQSVKWRIGTDAPGEVLRHKHSDFHFEVLKQTDGRTTSSSHFLKFDQAVPGLEKQRVAVAFPLDLLPAMPQFDQRKHLSEQMKIIPAEPGNVAVFFPAVNETSGLRFHLHGPFVPAMSRASIKDSEANTPLYEQIAALAAQTLHRIKELGLFSTEFLSVLPNPQDQISPRYKGIRAAIIEEMKSQPLTPTYAREHAPANRLIQARASLKELLSEDDIEFLVDYDDATPLWAIGATQRSSRIDNFLTGLSIRDWGLDRLIETLRQKVREEDGLFPTKPDEKFLSWLKCKDQSWMQEFYALMYDEVSLKSYLTSLCIVRLADGTLSRADRAFFATENTSGDIPVVDKAVYTSGTSKKQQDSAKSFLSQIGVREIGKAEEIEIILKRRYTKESELPDDATYLDDLKRFIALTEEKPDTATIFGDFYIFQAENETWYRPVDIYLDQPYMDTCLSAYYKALKQDHEPEIIHARYRECGIEAKRFVKFAQAAGVRARLEIKEDGCYKNPDRNHLFSAGGSWTAYGINRDYFIPKLDELLKTPSLELSRLIWRTLTSLPAYPDYLQAMFRNNSAHGPRVADSRLVHQLRAASWVPQNGGGFVRPADALRELLPEGFPFDPGFRWLKPVQFGETVVRQSSQALQKDEAAKSLGFADAAAAERARRFNDLPESEQEKILAEYENSGKSAVPDRDLASPKRRADNVSEQADKAPDKESEIRERSVSIGRDEVKEQADTYLREHYRNEDGEMTCQICKGPLPFKLDDGSEFFETVEFLPGLRKRHFQNYLALCPNHSAMYRHTNGAREIIRDMVENLTGNELETILAQRNITIYLSTIHVIDLKAVLTAEAKLPPLVGRGKLDNIQQEAPGVTQA
jgi:hypothetical protein